MPDRLNTGSVLGLNDFGLVGGTPLVPPSYLTIYFVLFLLLLFVLFLYFYPSSRYGLLVKIWRELKHFPFKNKAVDHIGKIPEVQSASIEFKQRIKLLVSLAFFINLVALVGGVMLMAYWLVPSPGIRRTVPDKIEQKLSPTNRIEIVFDRPVDRGDLEKSIIPDTPGTWVFENSLYSTHLYRKLVFYPHYSLRPDTQYKVKLSGIRNMVKVSKPYEYEFNFKTQKSPNVPVAAPFNEGGEIDIDSEINIVLDSPNENISEFNFVFDPPLEFDSKLDEQKTVYNLKPKSHLKQGTKYTLRIQKSDVILNLTDGSIVERGPETQVYERTFETKEAPGIKSFEPGNIALRDSDVVINFSKNMDKKSVEENFSIEPDTIGVRGWENESTFKFNPVSLSFDTEYKVTIKKGTTSLDGSFLEEDVIKTFRTIGVVKVSGFVPENNWTGVNIKSPIRVTFDQEVDHDSAQSKLSINPEVKGSFSWEGNTMIFTPEKALLSTTAYSVLLAKGIKSVKGQNSTDEFKISFTTQEGTTKLAVPAYLQKYTLSCEIASLRMALNFKGLNLSEDEIITKVGFDKTPHRGNTWGDPNVAFVGNIAGTQMADGYGVHWVPIARAARNYREAQEFTGWNVEQLTNELLKGNPVVIWVYSHHGSPTTWNTPDGKQIYAVRDEHAVTAVGFVGSPGNPTQLIINDPLYGQVYWSRSSFDRKWNIFGRSGVVVR